MAEQEAFPKPEECGLCQYRTEDLIWSRAEDYGTPAMQRGHWLCALCYGSLAGSSVLRYGHSDRVIVSVVCYVGNAILDAIKALKER